MSVIYKYPVVPMNAVQVVTMPSSSTILSAIEQHGGIVVYALVHNPNVNPVWNDHKRLLVLGTGWEFDAEREFEIKPYEEMRFINTVKTGNFVWHVFELAERSASE